ncbi:MAG TPA: hypothetical protein VLG92_01570 [Candidatus Saccharimonadia bacterium]|nr:hypothetical protein [Candidatus Saccharimonadia bacterium]
MTNPESSLITDTPESSSPTEAYPDLQREMVERGDQLLPGEPDRGFEVKRLDGEQQVKGVAPTEALPLCYINEYDGIREIAKELMADDIASRIKDGSVSITQVPKVRESYEKLAIEYPVTESSYRYAIEEGIVSGNDFDSRGIAHGYTPGAEALAGLVDPNAANEAIDIGAAASNRLGLQYRNDLVDLTSGERKELELLSEAFELTSSGKTMRILNFSETRLTDEQLRQATNVVRSLADKSGGGIFDNLNTISIFPESHSAMWVEVTIDGETKKVPRNGFQEKSMLVLTERLIQRPEDRSQIPNMQAYYDQFRLPDEPTEGPGAPKRKVSDNEWEKTLRHELEHIALPRNIQESVPLEGPAPTLYGRANRLEHVAELGAAEYVGGEDARAIPDNQRMAKQEMWGQYRGTQDGGLTYEQPIGPQFVICQELDLAAGPLPPILKSSVVEVNISYRLVPNSAAEQRPVDIG